jgi:peptidyl-prolyl cis-trans isomerase C
MTSAVQKAGRGRWIGAFAMVTCVLALAGCGRQGPLNRPPEPGDTAVATVDDQTVWASDVKREAVAQGLIGEGEALDISSDLFHRVLDEVVDQKLLAAEAVKRRVEDDPLAKRRLAAARERILGDMLVEGVVDQAVNDNAIQGLYQEQLKLAKKSQEYHLRQIVSADQPTADTLKKQLAAGASFEALAMEHSTDAATRFNGGDLDYLTADVMPDAYAAALKVAKTGDVVGPFKTDAGWVLLKVEDQRLEKPITLEQARPQIVRFLTYDKVRDLLEKLRGQSKVKVLIGPALLGAGSDMPREPASAPPAGSPGGVPSGAPSGAPSGVHVGPVTPLGPSTAESLLHGAPNGGPPPKPTLAKPKTTP